MDMYAEDAMQARIKGVVQQTLLAYRLTDLRYDLGAARLARVRAEYPGRVGGGGPDELRFRMLQIGPAALGEEATSYIRGLESILDRIEAGERFDPLSAHRYLVGAQIHLLRLQWTLRLHERHTEGLRRRAVLLTPVPYRAATLPDGSRSTGVFIGSRYGRD
jgi:hypothetical protein